MKKNKIYNTLLFFLIFLAILSTVILKPLDDLDEIWNYSFARNISKGLIPYKNFNIIVTPLLSMMCGIIIKIIADELIVMRVLAAILCSGIIFVIYKLFDLLKLKKELSIIFILFIGYLLKDIFCIDYNYASLLLALIIIYKEIEFYKLDNIFIKVDKKKDLLLGVLAGLAIITKQTSGILIAIAMLGNKLLFVKNKDEFKKYIKVFIYRLIGICIPVIVFIIYLLINNAFLDFINYTILGVKEFKNSISYKTLLNVDLLGALAILVPIGIIYIWVKTVIFEKDKNLYIFLVYGLALFVICFPISNKIHFMIGALPIIVAILYELNKLLQKIHKLNKINILKITTKFILLTLQNIVILFLVYYTIVNFYNFFSKLDSCSDLKHFKYIPIDVKLQNQIKEVDYFIMVNKDVKMLDAAAAVYMIPTDKYNKDYDMFNKGNLGIDGEKRIIEEIINSKDTHYLILQDKFMKNWQTPLNIIKCVKENKTKIGEIKIFDIYK